MNNLEYGMYELGRGIAELVFSEDYYEGPWFVYCENQRKLCPNYTTAVAWTKYFRRRGVCGSVLSVSKKLED